MIGSKKNQPQFNFDKKSNFISDFLPSIKNEDWIHQFKKIYSRKH